jgi:membrane fusion protein, multidrug efflux system
MSERGAASGSSSPVPETARPGPVAPGPRRRRGLLRPLLLVGVPLVVALAGLYWYAISGRYITTENAYVKSDIVTISTDIDGRVIGVEVTDNQLVTQGDVLFRIDPEPFQIALDMADANLVSVRHEIEASRAEFRQIRAEIDEAQERVRFFQQQAKRQRELEERGIAAQVRLEEAELELAAARQRVTALREKLRTVLARLGGDPASAVELHPAYLAAEARRNMAARDLDHTVVRAPVDGFVSRMRLQRGEWLEAGDPAFTIIDPQGTWIEANLKETQLTHIEVGQRVTIEVDAYPGQRWQGEVASISPATGAEFALIPPQNATGNWVKVVQRLPVRIAVAAPEGKPPLRAGMTVAVSIDTEREPRLAEFVHKAVASVRGGEP